jgi:hypothetical protein
VDRWIRGCRQAGGSGSGKVIRGSAGYLNRETRPKNFWKKSRPGKNFLKKFLKKIFSGKTVQKFSVPKIFL